MVVTSEVHDYLVAHGTPPDDVQRSLIEATAALGRVSRILVLLDNVLWRGEVVHEDAADENRSALRAVNAHVAADDRIEAVMLPIADGLTIARKR